MKRYASTLLSLLLVTNAYAAGNIVNGPDADLLWDYSSGEVFLDAGDTSSGVIISFVLATDQNFMRPENFRPPFIDVGTNTDATTFQIGQNDPLNQGAGPLIRLGNIFPEGIGPQPGELAQHLTLAEYASALGEGGTFDLIEVPEPSTLPLVLMGMMWFVRRGRNGGR